MWLESRAAIEITRAFFTFPKLLNPLPWTVPALQSLAYAERTGVNYSPTTSANASRSSRSVATDLLRALARVTAAVNCSQDWVPQEVFAVLTVGHSFWLLPIVRAHLCRLFPKMRTKARFKRICPPQAPPPPPSASTALSSG